MDIRNSLKFRDRKRPKAKQKFIATTRKSYSLRPVGGAEYCDQPVCVCVCVSVCLSASVSLEPLDRSARNSVCKSPVAVTRCSSDGVARRYALPVLWMTSRLAVMGATPKGGGGTQRRRLMTWRYRGGVWCLWMLVYTCNCTNRLQKKLQQELQ